MAEDAFIACGICGKRCRSLGHHLRRSHAISADAYRDQFGLRRGEPLTSPAVRARFSAAIKRTIAAGKLDAHFGQNAERAALASAAGNAEKQAMRASGIELPHGTEAHPHQTIAAVVEAVEAGAKVATAVKRAGIAYSSYHAGLARHPDLKARHEAARRTSIPSNSVRSD